MCGTSIWWYPGISVLPPSPDKVHVLQLVYISTYRERTGTYLYVPCLPKYYRGCFFVSYDCGKRYCMCMTCILWCFNTKSVPKSVTNIHDFILVNTWYILVCTCQYHYTWYIPVCTGMYWYIQVHTKYTVLVLLVTIPDVFWPPKDKTDRR